MDKMQNSASRFRENIGFSEKGRPLTVEFIGNKNAALKIFIIAAQHGDEKYSSAAVDRLIEKFRNREDKKTSLFCAGVLKHANPDGASKNKRTNEQFIDLNRDHQLLESKEASAIHSFVRTWKPQLVIDVHNFPTRRKHLLDQNLIINQDVFVDIPTNPAILPLFDSKKLNQFFVNVQSKLQSRGFICERYTLIKKSGQVRHSTADIKDARNSLALRYGIFTILLEGKEPTKKEGKEGQKRTILSQYYALRSIINWTIKNQKHFLKFGKYIPKQNELVPIKSKYRKTRKSLQMTFTNSITKKDSEIKLSNYSPEVEPTKFVNLPSYYAVLSQCRLVIDILKRHGFHYTKADSSIMKKISKVLKSENLEDEYIIFPTKQTGGRCLALYLEPESKYGLYRYHNLKELFSDDSQNPIVRIVK